MRLALLHFTAEPVIGGVERVLEAHRRLLEAAGHEVRVVAGGELEPGKLAGFLQWAEVVCAHNVLTMPFAIGATELLWRFAAAHRHQRVIAWTHDVAAANPYYTIPEGSLLRQHCPSIEYVAVSERRRVELHGSLGVPLDRCEVIPNGISPAEHFGISERWRGFAEKVIERDLVLLHPARLVRRKRIEVSVDVLAVLRRNGCDAALLVTAPEDPHQRAGAEYKEELLAKRAELDLENHAHFLSEMGMLRAADVDAFYRLADAVLFPSEQEGFGLPVLEAALHRLPIFCPAIEPLVSLPAGPGAFYPIGASPDEIAAQMMRTLGGCPAIKVRKETVRAYSWPAVYRKYIAPLLADPQTLPHP